MGNGSRWFGDARLVYGVEDSDVSCFADEVGIDFPSIAAAIDRIRQSFLAEERRGVSATVRLSPREARQGARVPLEVPVPCICQVCGGRGETWTELCHCCHGHGAQLRRHQLHVAMPAGVVDGARFTLTVAPRHTSPTRIELHVRVA